MRQRVRLALVVDDDPECRELSAACLERMGFATVEAENGARALEIAAASPIDVILMDLEMPVMGGLEAISRLRGQARTRDVPIVVLSGNPAADHARAKRAGATLSLAKPCAPRDLEKAMQTVMPDVSPSAADRASRRRG